MFYIRSLFSSIRHDTISKCVRYNRTNSRAANRRRRRSENPGVDGRLTFFNDKQRAELGTENLDELESDFMNIDKTYTDHVDEIEALKEREKYLIVKQKYFKEKYPNFLSWSDKEQIKYLHNSNSVEWTVEKLSQGFPASPEVIKVIWHF